MRNIAIAASLASLSLLARPNLTDEERETLRLAREKREAERERRLTEQRERIRPSIEPIREDYPSRQAFREAHRQWSKGPLS